MSGHVRKWNEPLQHVVLGLRPQALLPLRQPRGIEAAADERIATAAENLNTVFSLLRKACGIDFTHYKPNMVSRRIERRLLFNAR